MAELTYKSPGVGVREIDVSGPTSATPTGTPAGVIGTAERGPAFVPVIVPSYREFTNLYGSSGAKRFGPVAMYQWLKNSRAGLYVRVLGVGNAKRRTSSGNNAGKVENAGFIVGSQQIQNNGDLGSNPFAYASTGIESGRTHFLGCFMSESNGSSVFSSTNLQLSATPVPILRGVVMTPSGVLLALSSSVDTNNAFPINVAPSARYGAITGSVVGARDEFVMFLSGHVSTLAYPNVVTASFDPKAPNYFANIFNTDSTAIERAGHYLAASWDIDPTLASVEKHSSDTAGRAVAFVLVGDAGYNTGTLDKPNYENYEDRFRTPESPWVVSQRFGGETHNLFKVHALDDGAWSNNRVKISIKNIAPSTDPTSEYGSFDLVVRDFNDTDDKPVVLESFVNLSINPASQRYFARMIGDVHTYYDFERADGNQKLTVDGLYPNQSRYIRVEVPEYVQNQEVPASSLPVGFRGLWHLNTEDDCLNVAEDDLGILTDISQPPVPFRNTVSMGTGTSKRAVSYLHWGVQFESVDSLTEPNKNLYSDNNVKSYIQYYPRFQADWKNVLVTGSNEWDSF